MASLIINPFTGQFDFVGSGGGGGGGNSVAVDTFTLSGTDITNKGVVLSKIPTIASKVFLSVGSAPGQSYTTDYIIDSNLSPNKTLDWTGLGLDGILSAGDQLIVIYY